MKEKLTEEQAWSVVEFAQAYNDFLATGFYTPDISNRNLLNLNNNAETPDYNSVIQALQNGMNEGERLAAYNEWMEWADMIFKRTLEYYANMLSFELRIEPEPGTYNPKDLNKAAYKKDYKTVQQFLNQFKYKKEFKRVVRQLLRNETYYTWFRNNNNPDNPKYTLQIMPQSKCQLTGYTDTGLLYDFDMNYFLQPGIDIREYDPTFQEKYNEIFSKDSIQKYNPSNPYSRRDGTFATWVQTSPLTERNGLYSGAWAFKFDDGNFNQVPFLSGLLKDAILNIPIQKLQYDKDIAGAYALLIGEIEMLSTQETNKTAFDPKRLGALLNIVKQALGKYVAVGAMPTKEVEYYQYKDENTSMYKDQMQSTASTGAGASRVIYSSDKMSQEEIRNAIINDSLIMQKIYPQFENFLEFYINKMTKKFTFKIKFEGTEYPFEKKDRLEKAMKMAEVGFVANPTYYSSLMGFEPFELENMMIETKNTNWLENMSQLVSIHTQSGKDGDSVGAPIQDDVSSESREYDESNES